LNYLKEIDVLKSLSKGKEVIYINEKLFDLLKNG